MPMHCSPRAARPDPQTDMTSAQGTSIAAAEPGGITQGVRAMTWQLAGSDEPGKLLFQDSLPYSPGCRAEGRVDDRRCTFIDTPGHEVFELQRGRTMSAADVAVVVVSVEHGADVQTEEAHSWDPAGV